MTLRWGDPEVGDAKVGDDQVTACLCVDYKLLGILKRQFPKVPLIGLTATATGTILKDCEKILSVRQPVTITASFNRTNLYYEVGTVATMLTQITALHTHSHTLLHTHTLTHTVNVRTKTFSSA